MFPSAADVRDVAVGFLQQADRVGVTCKATSVVINPQVLAKTVGKKQAGIDRLRHESVIKGSDDHGRCCVEWKFQPTELFYGFWVER